MALPKLTNDLNVIQGLPDSPNAGVGGLTAEQLKVKFDTAGLAIQSYLNTTTTGLVDSVQASLDLKANSASPSLTNAALGGTTTTISSVNTNISGNVTLPSTTSIGAVTSAEIGYVDGVTSPIQTQLDAKAPIASPAFTGTATVPKIIVGTTNNTDSDSSVLVNGTLGIASSSTQSLKSQIEQNSSQLSISSNQYYSGGDNLYDSGRAPATIQMASLDSNSFIKFLTKNANTPTPNEQMRITSVGNVGIGTTTPSSKLGVRNTDSDTVSTMAMFEQFNAAGTDRSYLGIQADASNNMVKLLSDGTNTGGFAFIGGTSAERMRITPTGDVGIGTTTPTAKLDVNGTGNFSGVLTAPTAAADTNTTQVATTAYVIGQASSTAPVNIGSATIGTSTRFARADHTHALPAVGTAGTYAKVTTDSAGRVTSGTSLSASDIPALDTSKLTTGTLGIARGGTGVTSSTGSNNNVLSDLPILSGPVIKTTAGTTEIWGGFNMFTANGATSTGSMSAGGTFTSNVLRASGLGTGTVYSNAGTLTNTNPSDANLKTDITGINYGLDAIKQIRPVTYYWKDKEVYGNDLQIGIIAQELEQVVPEVVQKSPEGQYGVDYVKLIPVLVKAVQELNDKVKDLESKLNV